VQLLYPTPNGLIGAGASYTGYVSVSFPTNAMTMPVIAPWWGDIITQTTLPNIAGYTNAAPNNIYYRVSATPSPEDASRMASDVAASFPTEPAFSPSLIVAVTWFAVAPYNTAVYLDTLQAVLAADSTRSFVTLSVATDCAQERYKRFHSVLIEFSHCSSRPNAVAMTTLLGYVYRIGWFWKVYDCWV